MPGGTPNGIPQAAASGLDPVLHYLLVGARQGLDPGPDFSTEAYVAANPDVAAAGLNPLAHYLAHGRAEGRPLAPAAAHPGALAASPATAARRLPGPVRRARVALRRLLRPRNLLQVTEVDGFADTVPLHPAEGRPPTGWVLVRLLHGTPGSRLALRVLLDGHGREIALPPDAGPALVRLPDIPAPLGLGCGVRTGQDGLPDSVAIREIGRTEASLRLLWAHRHEVPGLLASGTGLRPALSGLAARHMPTEMNGYQHWIDVYDTPSRAQVAAMRARARAMLQPPRFSVIVPTFNTPARALREMISSVRAQLYPHWELCIADDASTEPHVRAILQEAAAGDQRIRLVLRETNGNISAASNSALALATGDFAALLDHDDVLAPHALLLMAEAIQANPGADILYSDEDKLDPDGQRYDPYFKPDYNPELLQGQNLISHFGVYRLAALRAAGGLRESFEGSQDYDLALRMAARTEGPIVHVPHILYHWRIFPGADTFSSTQISRATLAARRAIQEQAAALGEQVEVTESVAHFHRVVRRPPAHWPLVSAVVPTRDHVEVLRDCIDGLLDATDYPALEIIVVDNDSAQPRALAYLKRIAAHGVRVLPYQGPFNYSAINNYAARQAQGEMLLLLNNDISMTDPSWLREMVQLAIRPGVGAVGARLLYPDGTLQHGGVVLGLGGAAGHSQVGASRDDPGYFGSLRMTREVSAATGACLAVRREAFEAVGGLDEVNLPVAFNDVDLCLRLRAAGWRIIWTPHAELIHHESKSRGSDFTPERVDKFHAEVAYMLGRWEQELASDPFYSPNLSLNHSRPVPAFPPRVARPWSAANPAGQTPIAPSFPRTEAALQDCPSPNSGGEREMEQTWTP